MKKPLFIFGASGHAKVVIDCLEKQGAYELLWLIDDNPALKGQDLFGYPILGDRHDLMQKLGVMPELHGFIAIGVNAARLKVAAWFREHGIRRATIVHPSAQISRGVKIGEGGVVMAQAAINADTFLGDDVIVNTGASIDHDCAVGDGAHIAPGVRLCGGVRIGKGCLIGASAVIIPNIAVGNGVTVGAGSTVVRNLPAGVTVVGTPARTLPDVR